MVIDAGGGTIDISTYKQAGGSKGEKKGSFEEYSIPRCKLFSLLPLHDSYVHMCLFTGSLNGSVFVTARARSFLNGKNNHSLLYLFFNVYSMLLMGGSKNSYPTLHST